MILRGIVGFMVRMIMLAYLIWPHCQVLAVKQVSPPLHLEAPQSFWSNANKRKDARKLAARNVLHAIGYYQDVKGDVLTPDALRLEEDN